MEVKETSSRDFTVGARAWEPEAIAAGEACSQFRDCNSVILTPTRGMVHMKWHRSMQSISWPMNQQRINFDAIGMEVGAAYEYMVDKALKNDYIKAAKFPFIVTIEDDNLPAPDALQKLYAAIYTCIDCGKPVGGEAWQCADGHKGLDGVSGLYFAKGTPSVPMAFGDPREEGLDFRPRSVAKEIEAGSTFEVNGLPNGCGVFRRSLFERLSRPWFNTSPNWTHDLYFARKCKEELGARFAVCASAKVGHLEVKTGEIF